MIRVLIADDHNGMRSAFAAVLSQQDGIRVIDDVPDGRSAVERLKQSGIDVALIDMMMPDMEGDEVIRAVLAGDGYKPRMVIYSGFVTEDLVRRALDAGACGYLDKVAGMPETVKVIQAAARGEVCLCPSALKVVEEDVVAEAVRKNSERAFRVSPEQIVEQFLAHELSREDPTWPHDVRAVHKAIVASVPIANDGVEEILKSSGMRGSAIRERYRAIVGVSIKGYQTQLRVRLTRIFQAADYCRTETAISAGFHSTAALSNAFRRQRIEIPDQRKSK